MFKTTAFLCFVIFVNYKFIHINKEDAKSKETFLYVIAKNRLLTTMKYFSQNMLVDVT